MKNLRSFNYNYLRREIPFWQSRPYDHDTRVYNDGGILIVKFEGDVLARLTETTIHIDGGASAVKEEMALWKKVIEQNTEYKVGYYKDYWQVVEKIPLFKQTVEHGWPTPVVFTRTFAKQAFGITIGEDTPYRLEKTGNG